MRRTIVRFGVLGLAITTLAGCGLIRFDKAGEEDANSACSEISQIQNDGMTAPEIIAQVMKADTYASSAADANDDYRLLKSGVGALGDALMSGSEDLMQSSWANLATICNGL